MELPERDTVCDVYDEYVTRIARQLRRASSLNIEIEELKQTGMVGLLDAYDRFDPSHGVPFRAFAFYRVRGAMIDSLRALTGLSRSAVRKIVKLQAACEVVDAWASSDREQGRTPRRGRALYQGVVQTLEVLDRATMHDLEQLEREHHWSPEKAAIERERKAELRRAVAKLPDDARTYIEGHYFRELTLADIAREQSVSRSWASRLHARAIEELGRMLANSPVLADDDEFLFEEQEEDDGHNDFDDLDGL